MKLPLEQYLITPNATIRGALECIMNERGIRKIPLLNEGGHVVDIICSTVIK
jgi:hypothetical protein